MIRAAEDLVRSYSLAEAQRQTQTLTLTEFRTLYSSEIIKKAGVDEQGLANDLHKNLSGMPIPSTLTMELGSRLGEADSNSVHLFSSHISPQKSNYRKIDEFEERALAKLRQTPNEAFYEFTHRDGAPVLRYAAAD